MLPVVVQWAYRVLSWVPPSLVNVLTSVQPGCPVLCWWWNAQWFESEFSVLMKVTCLVWLQPISLVIPEFAPLLWRFCLESTSFFAVLFWFSLLQLKFLVIGEFVLLLILKVSSGIHQSFALLFWFSWLQLKFLVIGEFVLLLILKVSSGIHQSFALLLCFSLWGKHGSHSSGFSLGILFFNVLIGRSYLGAWQPEAPCYLFILPRQLGEIPLLLLDDQLPRVLLCAGGRQPMGLTSFSSSSEWLRLGLIQRRSRDLCRSKVNTRCVKYQGDNSSTASPVAICPQCSISKV